MSAKPSDPTVKWRFDQVEQVRRRWENGESAGRIAEALGLTKNQVSGIVWRRKFTRSSDAVHQVLDASAKRRAAP